MPIIKLTQNREAIVDESDFAWVSQWHWTISGNGYVCRYCYDNPTNKKRQIVLLHRALLSPLDGFEVDHINRNPLDNRRENLRLVTSQQNKWNAPRRVTNTTGYIGVRQSHHKSLPWRAVITKNYKNVHLGYFGTAEEAANAYDKAAVEQRGKYARLNFA